MMLQDKLDVFFEPEGVAVIGASSDPRKPGAGILYNLINHGYPGPIYPVNPRGGKIMGLRCYPSILEVPDPVELAVIVIRAHMVPSALGDCGERGLKGVIVISGGFREMGTEGRLLERELVNIIRRYDMRLLGPNCIGIIDTVTPLNTSFLATMPEPGDISFLSQSGAICGAIVDWTQGQGVGFARFVSLGNQADINETEVMTYLAEDPHTRVIVAYLEGVEDGTRFVEAAEAAGRRKPVVVLKVGKTEGGTRAISSHTGALAGSLQAYKAAFQRSGILEAYTVESLFDYSLAFAYQPLLQGDRIAVLTNGGGPGIVAADAVEGEGLRLVPFAPRTIERLRAVCPPEAGLLNPVDMLGGAGPERYAGVLEAVLDDPGVDGVLTIILPQVGIDPAAIVEAIGPLSRGGGRRQVAPTKPVMVCLMGRASLQEARVALNRLRIPDYTFPERAASTLAAMWRYARWLSRKEASAVQQFPADRERVRALLTRARDEGRYALSDFEARQIVQAYGIPVVPGDLARTAEEAVQIAEKVGYPVAVKIASPDVLHKTDIGGVILSLPDAEAVRQAFAQVASRARQYMPEAEIWGALVQAMVPRGREVIIGMNRDPQFGPLMMFGLGGAYVEALKDVSFRLAPLASEEAWEMMAEIRAHSLLKGVRGEPPADRSAIADCLLKASWLVSDFPDILEMDINPLIVHEEGSGAIAVDARMVIAPEPIEL
jgi:acetyl coenzyme A synthetase (ADP forming)-like protein